MISLQDNLIVGSLPNNLGNLVGLETFDMNGCSLAGSLPSTIGSAGSLTMLHISDSDLTGSFPTSFCRLSSLVSINLDRNFLTGTLPSVDAMQSLNTLYVNFNRLVGTIPEHYGQLPLLSLLGLYGNGLNGTVPDFSLSDLKFLFLGSNMLSGSFERLLSTFSPDKLQLLSVDTNQLTGTIPASLGNYTLLTFLYLQYNQLTGTLPTEVCCPAYVDIHSFKVVLLTFCCYFPAWYVNKCRVRGLLGRAVPQWRHSYGVGCVDFVVIFESGKV